MACSIGNQGDFSLIISLTLPIGIANSPPHRKSYNLNIIRPIHPLELEKRNTLQKIIFDISIPKPFVAN